MVHRWDFVPAALNSVSLSPSLRSGAPVLTKSVPVPLELQREVTLHFADELRLDLLRYCTSRRPNETGSITVIVTHDGLFLSAVVFQASAHKVKGWLELVHLSLRWPLDRIPDPAWWFWTKSCPLRFLTHIDLTLTRLSPSTLDMKTEDVVALGKSLSILHLHSLTLRTRYLEPLCNGLILWPPQLRITSILLCLGRQCPPDDWRRPLFPQVFHSFPALACLELQIRQSIHYHSLKSVQFHPAFERRMRETWYREEGRDIYRSHNHETPATTIRRMGHNVLILCPGLVQLEGT